MGLYNRDYTQQNSQFRSSRMPVLFPSLPPSVKWLIIINGVVFIAGGFIPPLNDFLRQWCSVYPLNLSMALQPWRPITYQFLHSGLWHLLFNMFALYFFGVNLERIWGTKKFTIYYLCCGIAGGILYPILALSGILDKAPLVGASGAILGVIAAVSIMFPRQTVYIYGIFPVPLIALAIFFVFMSISKVFSNVNAGGEIAHLAGMAVGAVYLLSSPLRTRLKHKFHGSRWQRNIDAQRKLQSDVDRILEKVYSSGIQSLSAREKRILKKATDAEKKRSSSKS